MEKKQFQAESKKLMDLMIHSIYTHKEIFLREIISNASDAIDKLAYRALTDDQVQMSRDDFEIFISLDPEKRLITVSDNGIGMTMQELEKNLGTIAKSGSLDFKQKIDPSAGETPDIIGQFGVGFYSAFMVSDHVTVVTKAYGSDTAYQWESSGADGYSITPCEKATVGTDIIIHVKDDGEEESYSEFLQTYRIRELIKKYSDYISWPIRMEIEKTVPKETDEKDADGNPKITYEKTSEIAVINSRIPLWQRSKSEVSDEDCAAYYREKYFEGDPLKVIRISAEGTVSYKAMLFVPKSVPFDFYTREYRPGISLYCNGVMIMDRCTDLVPDCFRFVRGVVDSPDLSLNISREMLQHDRQLRVIASNLEKKVKSELKKLLENDREAYESFYTGFGMQLKYGLLADYGAKKDLLTDLILFHSGKKDALITLQEYVDQMPEDQKYIYYACADTPARAMAFPQAEQVLAKEFDLLCFTQDVDEFAVKTLLSFQEKEFRNISSGDLGIEDTEIQKQVEEKEAEFTDLLAFMKNSLKDKVSNVKLSHKLKSHPVCLSTEGDISLEMERYFASLPEGQGGSVKAQRVLELNATHPIMDALRQAYAEDETKAEKLTEILFSQALLTAGLPLEDPTRHTELVCELF